MIQFGFYKKKRVTKLNLKKKTESKPVQTDRFRFGLIWFFRIKNGSNRLGRFFSFWLGFFGLSRFFSGLGSVRFFQFQTYKTETEPVGFFKILIGLIDFFSRFSFFGYFFLLSRFSRFFDFFTHP